MKTQGTRIEEFLPKNTWHHFTIERVATGNTLRFVAKTDALPIKTPDKIKEGVYILSFLF